MTFRFMLIIVIVAVTGTCHAGWDPTIELLAILTARSRINLDDTWNAVQYRALYNGQDDDGCDFVTIQRNAEPNGHTPFYENFNFRICHDMIDDIAETPPETPPPGLEQAIQRAASIAFREGKSFITYGGFEIAGNMLSENEIEIKVMKGMILYLYFIRTLR